MLKSCLRLGAVAVHLVRGVLICRFSLAKRTPDAQAACIAAWSRQLLRILGVRVDVRGERCRGRVLLVGNHVSWLDIVVLDAIAPVRFVSKADVRGWPLIGTLAAATGTFFIARGDRRDASRVVRQIAGALETGIAVAVFPEGTTGDGRAVLPFHASLVQSAIAAGARTQPLALRYADARSSFSDAPVYAGTTTLAASLWRIASADDLVAHVAFLAPIDATAHDRRTLAAAARGAIRATLDAANA